MRHRDITDLIFSSDSVHFGHFSDYHRFFSHAVWDIDQLWKLLATLIVNTLVAKSPLHESHSSSFLPSHCKTEADHGHDT